MLKSFILSLVPICLAATVQAACFADYKAKQDNPLQLHYGVAEVSGDCDVENAAAELAPALADDGWTLLTVLGVFDEQGLEERKDSAGDYFLRY